MADTTIHLADTRATVASGRAAHVGDLFHFVARTAPERIALIAACGEWTYAEAAAEIDAVAAALMADGIEPGDRVLGWLTNRVEFCFLAIAVARIGAVFVPMNTRYRAEDAAYVIRHAGARLLVLADHAGPVDFLGLLRAIEPTIGGTEAPPSDFPHVIRLSDTHVANTLRWKEFLHSGTGVSLARIGVRASCVESERPFLYPYTSGTTGNPKAAMHGHRVLRSVNARAARLGISYRDVIAGYLPLFHLYGFSEALLMSATAGACHVLFETFDAAAVLDSIEQHGITVLHGFDAHYRDILEHQHRCQRDVSSLRLATFPTGSDEAAVIAERVERELCPTVSGYGMTELWAFPCVSFTDSTADQRTRASGFPLPGMEMRCVDPDTNTPSVAGQSGEIQMRGYSVMLGYFRDDAATQASFTPDGWFRTGDMGAVRPDGHLRFLGRYKDMLKIGGENVAPAEVEAFLLSHPAVLETAIVGRRDERLGEVPVAFVRLRPEHLVDGAALIDFCRGKIASFKIPREIRFVDELPMTPTGKVRKNVLRDQLATEPAVADRGTRKR